MDVENKDVLHTSRMEGDITCLCWLQEKQQQQDCNQTSASNSHSQVLNRFVILCAFICCMFKIFLPEM